MSGAAPRGEAAAVGPAGTIPLGVGLAIAFATGFVALSYEILWVRVLSYVNGGQPWTFGALLGAYLLGVAVAARECEKLGARHPEAGPRHRAALAASVAVAAVAAYAVVPVTAALAPVNAWPVALLLVAGAAGALGAALPLTAHLAIPPDARAGAWLSYVYLADILGCAAGGVATGYFLLDRLPLATANVLVALLGLAVGAALLAAARLPPRTARAGLAAVAVAAAACVALGPALHARLWERLRLRGSTSAQAFAEVIENRHGVIAVTTGGVVVGGGVYDGAFSTDLVRDRNIIARAYGVAALHPAPRRVLLIGLGSGSWAQVLANLPGVERLTVIDINPGYLDLVRGHPEVASLLSNPRVEIEIDDARRWLRRHPDRAFDVVLSNGSFHWRDHATNLLSVEFARLVRSRLAPGGLYLFNPTGSQAARDTALAAFEHGASVHSAYVAGDAPFRWDGERLAAALLAMRIDGRPVLDPARPADRVRLEALRGERLVLERRRPGMQVVSDDNMLTEFAGWPWAR